MFGFAFFCRKRKINKIKKFRIYGWILDGKRFLGWENLSKISGRLKEKRDTEAAAVGLGTLGWEDHG